MEEQFYEIPEGNVGDMTFDETQKAINRFEHDQRNPAHPLNVTRSDIDPQKKAFMEYKNQLFEQRAATDDRPDPFDIALNEVAKKEQERKDLIHQAGSRDYHKLKEYGFEGAEEPPAEISPEQARLYRMQVLNVEGGQSAINELGNMISADMRKYNKSQELSGLFNTLMDVDIDADIRQNIGHQVIGYLDKQRRDALEKKPTKQTNFEAFKNKHNIEGNTYG